MANGTAADPRQVTVVSIAMASASDGCVDTQLVKVMVMMAMMTGDEGDVDKYGVGATDVEDDDDDDDDDGDDDDDDER